MPVRSKDNFFLLISSVGFVHVNVGKKHTYYLITLSVKSNLGKVLFSAFHMCINWQDLASALQSCKLQCIQCMYVTN